MKTLNDYSGAYGFLNKDLVYIGGNPNFIFGMIYKITSRYNISSDSEYRFYYIAFLNKDNRWESIPGNKLVFLSDYREHQLEQLEKK